MSEPENLILAHLRELRADMTARFDELDAKFETGGDRKSTRLNSVT